MDHAPAPTRPAEPTDWLFAAVGAAVVAFGLYRTFVLGLPVFGLLFVAVGLSIMPWAAVSLFGAVGMLAWGVWGLAQGATLQPVLALAFGVIAAAGAVRRFRGLR